MLHIGQTVNICFCNVIITGIVLSPNDVITKDCIYQNVGGIQPLCYDVSLSRVELNGNWNMAKSIGDTISNNHTDKVFIKICFYKENKNGFKNYL